MYIYMYIFIYCRRGYCRRGWSLSKYTPSSWSGVWKDLERHWIKGKHIKYLRVN